MYACSRSQLREAVANGFVVIETGEKTREENLERIYQRVFEKLNKLFMGIPLSGSRT
jgi:DNA/RNA-binding domain of Phe-tRNA-synthetase-like protein